MLAESGVHREHRVLAEGGVHAMAHKGNNQDVGVLADGCALAVGGVHPDHGELPEGGVHALDHIVLLKDGVHTLAEGDIHPDDGVLVEGGIHPDDSVLADGVVHLVLANTSKRDQQRR